METKKEIRSRLKKQRGLLGADECHNMSHEIYKRLIALELDRDYDNILLYSAIRNEVNTDEYFAYLIKQSKKDILSEGFGQYNVLLQCKKP